jgi:hypothetical protein
MILAGCAGNASSTQGVSVTVTSAAVVAPPGGGQTTNACALVSASDLGSLRVTGPGSPAAIRVGTATRYGCTWGRPPTGELHLQFEPADPAAATQVRETFGGHGVIVPGVGDVARGLFSSSLDAVDFARAGTFMSMQLYGTGADARKAAFLAVAKAVASRV